MNGEDSRPGSAGGGHDGAPLNERPQQDRGQPPGRPAAARLAQWVDPSLKPSRSGSDSHLRPHGNLPALEEDFSRLASSLESGAAAVQALGQQLRELDTVLLPSHNLSRRGRPPTIDRAEVARLHRQGLPVREIAAELEVSAGTIYRILGEEGLRPHETPEAALGRRRREEAIRLYQQGVPGAEIARRLGVSEPRVVTILREFKPPPPPKCSQEFERRAFDLLPQVESLRRDSSEENVRLDRAGPAKPSAGRRGLRGQPAGVPQGGERWRAGFVRHRALRALEDMEAYRDCQAAMRQAEASALPRLAVQAQQCIDRAMRLLRECCPPPPRPSPFRVPSPRSLTYVKASLLW